MLKEILLELVVGKMKFILLKIFSLQIMSTTFQIVKTIYGKSSGREFSFKAMNSTKLNRIILVFSKEN